MNLEDYKGIYVFIEQREGLVQNVALELLGQARRLADELNDKVYAMLLGHNIAAKHNLLLLLVQMRYWLLMRLNWLITQPIPHLHQQQ